MQKFKLFLKNSVTLRHFLLATAIVTFLLIMMGYVVRFDGVESACPDWPTCYGQAALPVESAARLEMAHRGLALIAGMMVLAASIWALRSQATRITRHAINGAIALIGMQVLFGAGLVIKPEMTLVSPLHLAFALAAMALIVTATVSAYYQGLPSVEGRRLDFSTAFSRLVLVGVVTVFVLMVSGALVATLDVGPACQGWPFCAEGAPGGWAGWLSLAHRGISLAAGIIIGLIFFRAWRGLKAQPFLLSAASGVALLFAGQVLIGALKVNQAYPAELVGLHAATAAGLWAVLVALAVGASLTDNLVESRPDLGGEVMITRRQRIQAFVMLNKPIIVALLLVTTYAGMVVGGKQIPSFWLTFWTLLGGALAAGGASALNQYIDREIDLRMQRTAKRPLPAGLLSPAEALAYGIAACLAAFFILAGFVNLLAAMLSLAGMIYYVLIYSIWLKHATVQNIVIGGGAGAIPPLVGWAAATGSLNIPALFLFALVFMWTPPHFWALALVRAKDYARAGVPMLPVVKGEKETRQQIFIYTLELVGLTLLMPIFKIAGSVFLVSAVVLGLWLIVTAWKVLRQAGNKQAWRMYRYSSMYLAFIFLALVVDVLV